MPYVFYEELPEGLEAASVVSQEHYDALAEELAGAMEQREEALTQIEEAQRAAREVKAKYAQMILDGNKAKAAEPKETDTQKAKATTIDDLFA